ncbi:MAG: RsmB/NOP family class I SAM-dependent RNA methyltransferase [Candidatus Amesbacteria bacterium]|nr:RsmB/NOP family class I SAM-dependent RNA methyltransferase [Candidatus Amesbacteria bacterium]
MLPDKFLQNLPSDIKPSDFDRILPTTFRVNTLKSDFETIKSKLDFEYTVHDGAFITNHPLRQIQELDIYKKGEIYVQGLSSMLPPIILDPKPNEIILDICSAPGSKTSQMAALMQNTGQIIANDNSRIRIYKLEANLKNLGVTNTTIINTSGQTLWQKYPDYFDKALVDVPCSMEGRFSSLDPKSYKDWSPAKVKELAQLQKFLLRSAFGCTKPGGTIVYSTCTLNTRENEQVIEWLLEKEKDRIELISTQRINPSPIMEGFFVAKLRKI